MNNIEHKTLFRIMSTEDLPFMLAIERQSYLYPWSEGIFRDCLRVGYHCRVMEVAGSIAGYAVSSVAVKEAHILNLCIHPQLRRQGLGRRLLDYVIDESRELGADTLFLEVRQSNQAAIQLYRDHGFDEIGVRKNYYPADNGKEDALMMARIL